MKTVDSATVGILQEFLIPPIATLAYLFAEPNEIRIPRIHQAITAINAHSEYSPVFEIVSGTLSNAAMETESIGVEIALGAKVQYGVTVKCTSFTRRPEMIRFFEYLAKDSEITSFMPCEIGGGNLKGVDQAIADCVRKNKTLEALDVHFCEIGKEGVLNIVNALEQNSSLKYLNVRANGISNEILTRLLEILKTSNQTLIRFSFTQGNFADEMSLDKQLIRQLDAQLRTNAQLRTSY